MANDTPRFGLGRFDQGDQNWDHTDTVELVDEHAIARGPVSERPSSGEYDGELYFAMDDVVLYAWDAGQGAWVDTRDTSTDTTLPAYSSDSNAGASELYRHTGEGVLKYKNDTGSVVSVHRDDASGYFQGYQSSDQSGAHNGIYANFAENTPVADGPFTFDQDSGGSRQSMAGVVELAGTQLNERLRSSCYIRDNSSGRRNSVHADAIVSASAGDSVQLYVLEEFGGQGTDLIRASLNLELLG